MIWVIVQFHTASDLIYFVGQCDLYFMVQWFCPVSFRILVQSDTVSDLILFVGHCDLYLMVQWFCIIPLLLIARHHTLGTCSVSHWEWPYIFCRSLRHISWSSDFALYLRPNQIGMHHTSDTCSIWHCQWTHTICRSLWPVFMVQ